MKNVVSSLWLFEHIDDENLFIFDCQFDLFDSNAGHNLYEQEHLPKAFYLDLNEDLSGKPLEHGGARPIPDSSVLKTKLQNFGVRSNSTIVLYDTNFYSSPRAWWQLKFMGFEKVFVLEGGISAWKSFNFPTCKDIPKSNPSPYPIKLTPKPNWFTSIDTIKPILDSDVNFTLIDSRNPDRFSGKIEPLYSKKGHIPKAINIPWDSLVSFDNNILNKDSLKNLTKSFNLKDYCITYCGSGIEGAVSMLILDELDYNVSLYVGSMSDWISYEELPVENNIIKNL